MLIHYYDRRMSSRPRQDILIAETDWPVSCPSSLALSEPSIAKSAAGQQTWVKDIESVLSSLPGGHGLGVVYWEPGWIGNAGLGSSCSVRDTPDIITSYPLKLILC